MTFQQRLKKVLKGGNLTVADLSRWFDRPDPTVRDWVERGRAPSGAPGDLEHVKALLELLEAMITKKVGLPVPRMSQVKRKDYLGTIRQNALENRAS